MTTHSISCLENPMDRGAWQSTVHWVAQSQKQLNLLSTQAHHNKNIRQSLAYSSYMFTVFFEGLSYYDIR